MLRTITFLFIFMIYALMTIAQKADPEPVAMLPPGVDEASGLETKDSAVFWVHNDSGDDAVLYEIGYDGQLRRKIFLRGVKAVDFEDVARDEEGNLYIGDVGNNKHQRDPLYIYKIPSPGSLTEDTVQPEIIVFGYEDQKRFPPPESQQVFDCESILHFEGKLYLFSKNYGVSDYTKVYSLPDSAGNYQAKLLDSFKTGGLITAADVNPSGNVVVLLSVNHLWLLHDFEKDAFFRGKAIKVDIPVSQKEGVVFADDSRLFIVDERNMLYGFLYSLDIDDYLQGNGIQPDIPGQGMFELFPNPAGDKVNIGFELEVGTKVSVRLWDQQGKSWELLKDERITAGSHTLTLDVPPVSTGAYRCSLQFDEMVLNVPLIIVNGVH